MMKTRNVESQTRIQIEAKARKLQRLENAVHILVGIGLFVAAAALSGCTRNAILEADLLRTNSNTDFFNNGSGDDGDGGNNNPEDDFAERSGRFGLVLMCVLFQGHHV